MRLIPIFILATAGAATIALSAQQDPQPARPGAPQDTTRTTNPTNATESDGYFATWLLVGSNNEVALSQLAQQRAQDPEVKQFAQKMVDDHRQLGQKLQAFAATAGSTGKPEEASAGQASVAGEIDHVALAQELGKQCLDTARKELEAKQGEDFDRCYMGMAIGGHMHANDMMTVFQRHASGQLKTVIAEGQKVVQAHLEHAKSLSKRLESKTAKVTGDGK